MSDRVEIKITGSNQTGAAFQGVARDAQAMGNSVDQAGQKAGRSLQDLSAKSALVGAAIGSATMVLGEWSRAAADDAANQSRLQQSIENTGKSYDEYSQAVEKAIKAGQDKAFSDDATREALVRLNAVTNDTGQSLDQLSLAMDFARARGISLADSAGIIAKVYGGNLGILSRYGIVLEEGATATEALAKIQQISAGQAETYADSQLGQLDKMKDRWDELTESIGGSTGELQQFLMLLPGLSAGMTALSALAGGIGGAGLIAGGLVAANAAAIYLAFDAYNGNSQAGGDYADYVYGNAGVAGAGLLKKITPGAYGDEFFDKKSGEWGGILDSNQIEDVIAQMFFGVDNVEDVGRIITSITQAGGFAGFDGIESLERLAKANYQTIDQYIASQATIAGYTVNANTGQLLTPQQAGEKRLLDSGAGFIAGAGLSKSSTGGVDPYGGMGIYNPFKQPHVSDPMGSDAYYAGPGPAYARGGSGAVANSLSGIGNAAIVRTPEMDAAAAATQTQMLTDALVAQYPAWEGIIRGMNSASDAQDAFKAAQDGLIGSQGVYSQQQSEYSGQLNALTAGYEILQERQNNGVELTKEEQALLANYPGYYERLTGGVEDATVAEALLAAQYAENMSKGDEMNQKLGESTGATQSLVDVIEALILSMDGVPEEVRTKIELDNAAEATESIRVYNDYLNSIPTSRQTTLYVTTIKDFIGDSGSPLGGRLGGVIGYANGGTVRAELAEAGPELLHFRNGGSAWAMNRGVYNVPKGTYVDTAPASKLKAGGNQGGGIHLHNPTIYVYPATGDVQREFTNALVGDWRTG